MKKTICGHPSMLVVRGLCKPCYAQLLKLVVAGKTTWAALEQTGKCLPAGGSKNILRKSNNELIRVPFKGAKQ